MSSFLLSKYYFMHNGYNLKLKCMLYYVIAQISHDCIELAEQYVMIFFSEFRFPKKKLPLINVRG